MTATLTETDDLTVILSKAFGDNAEAREAHFKSWFAKRFGARAAAKEPILHLKQDAYLGGRTMMDLVKGSDTGRNTVIHMLTPVSA